VLNGKGDKVIINQIKCDQCGKVTETEASSLTFSCQMEYKVIRNGPWGEGNIDLCSPECLVKFGEKMIKEEK